MARLGFEPVSLIPDPVSVLTPSCAEQREPSTDSCGGTAFHQGALTVPGGRQVGTGVVAGCHTALIGGIGWARQG